MEKWRKTEETEETEETELTGLCWRWVMVWRYIQWRMDRVGGPDWVSLDIYPPFRNVKSQHSGGLEC